MFGLAFSNAAMSSTKNFRWAAWVLGGSQPTVIFTGPFELDEVLLLPTRAAGGEGHRPGHGQGGHGREAGGVAQARWACVLVGRACVVPVDRACVVLVGRACCVPAARAVASFFHGHLLR